MIVSPLAAQASNSGLQVIVTVPDADAFYTELRFVAGGVDLGETSSACVFIFKDLRGCEDGVNHKSKEPERITI